MPEQNPEPVALLPTLLPKAIEWAERHSNDIARRGRALDAAGIELARRVDVEKPQQIRLLSVDAMPPLTDPLLREVAARIGFLGDGTIGLTLGYGIYIRHGFVSPRLLSHEFRHVHQYEQAGSIAAFLGEYLRQIVECGYENAAYERDARAHEKRG